MTIITALLAATLVLVTHKGINGESLYNISPLVIALLPIALLKNTAKERIYGSYGFSLAIIAIVFLSYLTYVLQIGMSSTSSLMFIWLPLMSLIVGCFGAIAGIVLGLIHEYLNRKRPNQAL